MTCIKYNYCKCDAPIPTLKKCIYGNCTIWYCKRCYKIIKIEKGLCFNPYPI